LAVQDHLPPGANAARVARWYIFNPKPPIWENFAAISYGILWPLGIFCGHFGNFFQFWDVIPRKYGNPERGSILKQFRMQFLDEIRGQFLQSSPLGVKFDP
jgi:hypothetical protein